MWMHEAEANEKLILVLPLNISCIAQRNGSAN
jgi:hypothetical protein